MASFEHVELEALWSDFTKVTPMEESISTVELKLRETMSNLKLPRISRFGYHGKYYKVKYVPPGFSESGNAFNTIYEPDSASEIIRALFGVTGGLLYVFSKNSIDISEARELISVLTPAVYSCGTNLPIFVQVTKAEYQTFLGFSIADHVHTHMSSHTDWSANTIFSDFNSILKIFHQSTGSPDAPYTGNSRMHFEIDQFDFGDKTKFTLNKYYSRITQDPIKSVKIVTLTPEVENPTKDFQLSDAQHFVLAMKTVSKQNVEETSLTRFVKFIEQSTVMEKFTCYNEQKANEKIDEVFKTAQVISEKTILKAAPKDSILTKLVVEMASSQDIHLASSIWSRFLAKLRAYYDKKTIIPGIGTGCPEFEHCIIYQKLQMLNYCIVQSQNGHELTESQKMDKKLLNGNQMINPAMQKLAPARTEDQIVENEQLLEKNYDDQLQKSRIQSRQLSSDISAFKAENEGAVFEDFVRWYSHADYNEKTKELSQRMSDPNNLWRDLWDKAVPKLAKDQEPTFDALMQAELVLDYLETSTPTEVFGDLVPVLLSSAYYQITNDFSDKITFNRQFLARVSQVLEDFHKEYELPQARFSLAQYTSLSGQKALQIEKICAEHAVSSSMLQKLPGCINLVQSLLNYGFCVVSSPEERAIVFEMMKDMKVSEGKSLVRVENCFAKETANGKNRLYTAQYYDRLGLPNHVVIATSIEEYL